MKFSRIKIIKKPKSEASERIINKISSSIESFKPTIVEHYPNLTLKNNPEELIITVGGDGTFISILRNMENPGKAPINICGINAGKVGILCSFDEDDLEIFNDLMETKSFPFRTRKRYLATIDGSMHPWERYFVNETTVSTAKIARLYRVSVKYGNVVVEDFLADGVIISSPFGSTAYNLSAGGSIVHHELEAFSITPICPHNLTHRSLVLPDYREIEIISHGNQEGLVTLDGQETREIRHDERVKIKPTDERIYILRNPKEKYIERMKEKLQRLGRV